LVKKLTLPKLTNKQRAVIVGILAVAALLYLWFGKSDVSSTKHITAIVEQHKQEVKNLEKNIDKIRKETDANVPKAESLDIDPLVDWFNGWLRSREEDQREHRIDY
jgi:hypothetical protein